VTDTVAEIVLDFDGTAENIGKAIEDMKSQSIEVELQELPAIESDHFERQQKRDIGSERLKIREGLQYKFMKYVVLIGDGMADRPVEELKGLTVLQKAAVPNMDCLPQWNCRHGADHTSGISSGI